MTDERQRPPARRPAPRPPARKPAARRPAQRTPTSRTSTSRPVSSARKAAQPRLKASLAVVLVLLVVLGSRMVQLQGIDSAAYSKRAEAQRSQTVTLAATRGAITDRWGHVLADDLDLRLIFVDPTLEKHAQATADALSPLIKMPSATLLPLLQKPGTRYVPLAHLVEPSVAVKVLALRYPDPSHPGSQHLGADPAIGVNHETTRDHPGKDLAAALVGVTNAGSEHGETGIEALLDGTLSGTPGRQEQEVDPSGTPIPGGTILDQPAVDGSSVRLTIDRDLQYAAQQALDAQVQASNARGGQVIVMDPKTGQVLALASAPGFDASKPVTSSDDLHIPALENPYEPGSVNKVITATAAIQNGVETPGSEVVVPPVYHYPGRPQPLHDSEVHGTEDLTFAGVLAVSSNIGTDIVAQKVGDQALFNELHAFGLGEPSGLAYPGETSGYLPSLPWKTAAATIPFGQGMSVTALQIADAYQAIANGGVRIPAQLVRSTVSADGTVHPYPGQQPIRVASAATAATVSRMLEAVTKQGTAQKAQIAGYRVAGKTGTASAIDPKNGTYDNGQYVDSFIGFAPADNPRLLVEVVIDHPEQGSIYGGDTAAPVFKTVMGFGLREFGVPPTGTRSPNLRLCVSAAGCPVSQ